MISDKRSAAVHGLTVLPWCECVTDEVAKCRVPTGCCVYTDIFYLNYLFLSFRVIFFINHKNTLLQNNKYIFHDVMNKRKYPYGIDMCPQLKIHVGEKQVNNGVLGPSKMSEIYGKNTPFIHLLYLVTLILVVSSTYNL